MRATRPVVLNAQPEKTLMNSLQNDELYALLNNRLAEAERKHPVFAEGIYQGFGRIGEEYGEVCQAMNHGESDARIEAEAMDLLVVAWRFVRGDYRQ